MQVWDKGWSVSQIRFLLKQNAGCKEQCRIQPQELLQEEAQHTNSSCNQKLHAI